MRPFNRVPRGTIFVTGDEVIRSFRPPYDTFCKLSATVAVPIENGQTVPSVQYIPHLNQRCTVLGHVND